MLSISDEALIAKYPELFQEAKNWWRVNKWEVMQYSHIIDKQGYSGLRLRENNHRSLV